MITRGGSVGGVEGDPFRDADAPGAGGAAQRDGIGPQVAFAVGAGLRQEFHAEAERCSGVELPDEEVAFRGDEVADPSFAAFSPQGDGPDIALAHGRGLQCQEGRFQRGGQQGRGRIGRTENAGEVGVFGVDADAAVADGVRAADGTVVRQGRGGGQGEQKGEEQVFHGTDVSLFKYKDYFLSL